MFWLIIGLMLVSAAGGAFGGYWFRNRNIKERIEAEVKARVKKLSDKISG